MQKYKVEYLEAKLLESNLWKQPTFQGPTVLMFKVAGPQSEDKKN